MSHYDLMIMGAGSGNSILTPDFDGWRVAIVEEGPLGGTCLNRGCIPSKMFVYAADLALAARHGDRYGIDIEFHGADWPAIRDRIFGRIDPIADAGLEYRLGLDDVDVYQERGRFVGEKRLEVGGEVISADHVVLAAGAQPIVPAIPGLAESGFHTSDTIMRLDSLPDRLAIIGSGYIATEMAHVFDALGSRVTILARGDRLLREEDHDISDVVTAAYAERLDLRLRQPAERVDRDGDEIVITTADDRLAADELLVAVGRRPNGESLGVDETGVALDARGYVVVDEYGRTNVEGIWALGDISSDDQLKHKANADARIVAHNLAHPEDLRALDLGPVPHAVFGSPQVASVGSTEAEAAAADVDVVSAIRRYSDTAYGWAMEDTTGLVKVIADRSTRLLVGAHIAGPQASTLIQQLIQGMRFGQTVDEMARHQWYIHPALSEVVEQALLEL